MPRYLLVLASSALLSACAATSTSSSPEVIGVPEYREFLAELREGLDKGIPRELSRREMERFERLNRQIHTLLAGVDDVDQLDRDDQIELFNTHEALWATLVGAGHDQVVCRRVSRVGTRFKDTRCQTLSEIHTSQRNAQLFLGGLREAPDREFDPASDVDIH